MKKLIYTWLFLFILSTNVFAETYKIDNQHTFVLWHVSHFNFSHPTGKWMADGTLIVDPQKLENSKVNAVIHIATLNTGVKELDEHLMTPLFFDVKKYPDATFVSDKVDVTGKSTAKVSGMLTLRGVSKPVILNVKLNQSGISPITNKKTLGFSANTIIKRSDFGMTTLLPGVGDEVRIDIEAEAFVQ